MEFIEAKIKSMYKTTIIFSIILFLLGLFLFINPETTIHAISYILGICLIIWGIIPIISFFTNKEGQNYLDFGFIMGIFSLIFGCIIMINPDLIGGIVPLLIGIWMMINGLIKLYYALTINKQNNVGSAIIISLIILVFGLLLIFKPFAAGKFLTQFIGVSIMAYSILDLVECYTLKKAIKKIGKGLDKEEKKSKKEDPKIIEAEYEEE